MKNIELLTTAAMVSACSLSALTIPYTNDFSGTGANTAFAAETTAAEWALASGAYQWTYSNTVGGGAASSATNVFTNVDSSFVMETQFSLAGLGSLQNPSQTLGFGLFGADSAFSGSGSSGGNAYYLADYSYAAGNASTTEGVIRILNLGESGSGFSTASGLADDNSGSTILAVELDTTYTLRLAGTVVGSTLNMTLSLYDAAGTTQIGTSAVASDTSPLSGENFGYRNRASIGGGSTIINFDNYSATSIPEPSTYAMVLGLVGALALLRRRRV